MEAAAKADVPAGAPTAPPAASAPAGEAPSRLDRADAQIGKHPHLMGGPGLGRSACWRPWTGAP